MHPDLPILTRRRRRRPVYLHDQVEVAQVAVAADGRVGANHQLVLDARGDHHVLSHRKAQSLIYRQQIQCQPNPTNKPTVVYSLKPTCLGCFKLNLSRTLRERRSNVFQQARDERLYPNLSWDRTRCSMRVKGVRCLGFRATSAVRTRRNSSLCSASNRCEFSSKATVESDFRTTGSSSASRISLDIVLHNE